jgi:hypothetical protein
MDPEDVRAYRAMTLQERLTRSLEFTGRIRASKSKCVRTHHPGWSEEKTMNEVRRWVRNGRNPAELYEWWPPDD